MWLPRGKFSPPLLFFNIKVFYHACECMPFKFEISTTNFIRRGLCSVNVLFMNIYVRKNGNTLAHRKMKLNYSPICLCEIACCLTPVKSHGSQWWLHRGWQLFFILLWLCMDSQGHLCFWCKPILVLCCLFSLAFIMGVWAFRLSSAIQVWCMQAFPVAVAQPSNINRLQIIPEIFTLRIFHVLIQKEPINIYLHCLDKPVQVQVVFVVFFSHIWALRLTLLFKKRLWKRTFFPIWGKLNEPCSWIVSLCSAFKRLNLNQLIILLPWLYRE